MRKTLWILVAALLVIIAAPNAHADIVTLEVSGTLSGALPGSSCSISGCTLGGDVVIDNVTGAFLSADVTFSGSSPSVGPFVVADLVLPIASFTELVIRANPETNGTLLLAFVTNTPGSLVGYSGGPLFVVVAQSTCCAWSASGAGALTPAVAAPEPSSVALMLLGVGFVFVMRKRIGEGLPEAS